MSLQKTFSQIPANQAFLRTFANTQWLYPPSDIQKALSNTTYKYSFDGTLLICPDLANLEGVYSDIFNQTAISQPVGNTGFTIGAGTLLQNMGKRIYWQTPGGNTVFKWLLVKQLTPQTSAYVPIPGDSPNETVGYITVYSGTGYTNIFDSPLVVYES